jgi:hypothetical protein
MLRQWHSLELLLQQYKVNSNNPHTLDYIMQSILIQLHLSRTLNWNCQYFKRLETCLWAEVRLLYIYYDREIFKQFIYFQT